MKFGVLVGVEGKTKWKTCHEIRTVNQNFFFVE